jgi:hypothetical protein
MDILPFFGLIAGMTRQRWVRYSYPASHIVFVIGAISNPFRHWLTQNERFSRWRSLVLAW